MRLTSLASYFAKMTILSFATAVAERLHVHRNTVLYRMNKIQERFDLDLADPDVREKMIIEFKMIFLLQSQRKDHMGKVSAT